MSDRILLKVRPGAVTNGRKAKTLTKTYELPLDRFISVEVGERQMFFELYLPAFKGRVRLITDGAALKPAGGLTYAPPNRDWNRFTWRKDPIQVDSQRVRSLTIKLEGADGNVANHTLQLQVAPEPLDSMPQLLLDDLTHQLHLDWQQTRNDSLRPETEYADQPRFNSWATLERGLQGVLGAMAQIGQRPFQQLQSVYKFQPFSHHQRLDPHTYRWLAQRGLHPHKGQLAGHRLPVPYSQPTQDCPENRFVYGVLQLIIQMLQALEAIFAGEKRWLEEQLFLAQARNRSNDKKNRKSEVEKIQKRLVDLEQKQRRREKLLHRCFMTKQSPFFQQWHDPKISNELTQPPIYSLVLAQNEAYRQVFEFYNTLMASNRADGLVRTSRFVQGVQQAGQATRATIYETWMFVRIYCDLKLLGFTPKPGRDLNSMIEGSRLTPTLHSGDKKWLELCKDLPNKETVTLRLFHEKAYFDRSSLPNREEWAWRPDVTLEILYGQKSYLFFLDAKFIDFAQEGDISLHKKLFAKPGKYRPKGGIEKYLHIPNACGSFILHPATHPDFENYGAATPNHDAGEPAQKARSFQYRLGYLPFRPQQTTAFRKWLGLVFILYLQQYQYCWNCHQTNVSSTAPNYHCPDCQTNWNLARCRSCRFGPVFSGEEAPFNMPAGARRPFCAKCGEEA